MGLQAQECNIVLNNTKNHLLTYKSTADAWEQIQKNLNILGMTKTEANDIIVAVGKHLLSRIK